MSFTFRFISPHEYHIYYVNWTIIIDTYLSKRLGNFGQQEPKVVLQWCISSFQNCFFLFHKCHRSLSFINYRLKYTVATVIALQIAYHTLQSHIFIYCIYLNIQSVEKTLKWVTNLSFTYMYLVHHCYVLLQVNEEFHDILWRYVHSRHSLYPIDAKY